MSVHAFSSALIQPPRCYAAAQIPANSICAITWDAGNSRFAIAIAALPANQFVRTLERIDAGTYTTNSTLEFINPVIPAIAGEALSNSDVGAAMECEAGKAIKGATAPTLGKYVPVKRGSNTTGAVAEDDTIYIMRYHA